jgi:hypothetical protein
MYNIEGGVNCPGWLFPTLMLLCVMVLVLIGLVSVLVHKSSFANMPDYGIGQRGDMIAAIPSYEEESLRQKVDRWSKPTVTSQLTGSRDVPVFFQDYDVEAKRNVGTALTASREGFEGGKKEDELERALAGRN